MSSISAIAASGLHAASRGLQAVARNIASLATLDAAWQGVALSSLPRGGVVAHAVQAPPDPGAPLEDAVAMLTYRNMAGANGFVLEVAGQALGRLLDVRV